MKTAYRECHNKKKAVRLSSVWSSVVASAEACNDCLRHVLCSIVCQNVPSPKYLSKSLQHFILRVLWSLLIPAIWSCHQPIRGVVSVRLRMLLVGTCRLCGSWSVAGQNHRKVTGQDPICADLHDMGLSLSRYGGAKTTYDEGEIWLWIVGSVTIEWLTTEATDQSSIHCVVVSTGATSDHIWHRDASRGGGCLKTKVRNQLGWVPKMTQETFDDCKNHRLHRVPNIAGQLPQWSCIN